MALEKGRTTTKKTTKKSSGRKQVNVKDLPPLEDELADEAVEVDPLGVDLFLSQRLRYHPRPGEAKLLDKIDEAATAYSAVYMAEADAVLEHFYASVREPQMTRAKNGSFVPKVVDGEVVYKRNPDGSYIEKIEHLDGGTLELTIITLDRVIAKTQAQVSLLHERAKISQEVKNEEYFAAFREPLNGLKDAITGYARSKSMDSRYHFLYDYLVYQRVKDKLDTLRETKRSLEFLRSRALKTER